MTTRSTRAWCACMVVLAVACGESHSTDDGGTVDAGTDATSDIGPRRDSNVCLPPSFRCVRGACCDEDPMEPEPFGGGSCGHFCPDGWTSSESCEAEPECSFNSCTIPEDCVLAANTCCGVCGMPTLADVDAINVEQRDAHFMAVCPEPMPCPDCPSAPNPNLGATCAAGTCEAYDLSMMRLTECIDDGDCGVRVRDCCECGADTSFFNLIAIRVDADPDYQDLVCEPDFGCLACEPDYPADVRAFCDAGRCALEMIPTP